MPKTMHKRLAPHSIGVKSIPIVDLMPNPHNPRLLFDRVPLDILKASIGKVGILVPLTVYWNKQKAKYVILDGQRRWICATELGLKEVPVNQVAEPSLVQNIVTMFQIHKLRADWELMPTALKLEVLMGELAEKNEKKLAALTGLDQAVVVRCKKLLSFPKKYQDRMLDPDPQKRVKADFFIELYPVSNDRFVMRQEWFSRDDFTDRMLDKYQHGSGAIKAVTDFRTVKQHITNACRAKKENLLSRKLKEFVEDTMKPVDHLLIEEADVSASARKLMASIEKIESDINNLDVQEFYGEEELWSSMERLLKLLRSKLNAAGRRVKE
jgi:ParB family transcriptional regulator, chromosome partitioning protein